MSGQLLNSSSRGTIIVHDHVANSAITRLLEQKQYKIKTSQRVVEDSIIFPQAKLAFLVVEADQAKRMTPRSGAELAGGDVAEPEPNLTWNEEFLDKLEKLQKRHQQSYIILQAPLFTSVQFAILLQLQTKYLHASMDFLPAHSPEECVEAILTLATVQMSPRRELLHERYCELMNNLLQPQPHLYSASPGLVSSPRTVASVREELFRQRQAQSGHDM